MLEYRGGGADMATGVGGGIRARNVYSRERSKIVGDVGA